MRAALRRGQIRRFQVTGVSHFFSNIYTKKRGATGIRTPDLLHAISRQHVHSRPSAQVTVPGRAHESVRNPGRLRYFPAVPASLPGQAPNKRLTSQNLQELYRGALQGDQHPTAPDQCRTAPAAVPGSGHDHRLSPTAASPRSELPATAGPFGRQSPAGHSAVLSKETSIRSRQMSATKHRRQSPAPATTTASAPQPPARDPNYQPPPSPSVARVR